VRVLHVRPSRGGIAAYGQVVTELYRHAGIAVQALDAPDDWSASRVVRAVDAHHTDVVHFEIGVAHASLLWASRRLLRTGDSRTQIVTIHDPGLVVRATAGPGPAGPRPLRYAAKVARAIADVTVVRVLIANWRRDEAVVKVYLRPDLGDGPGSHYLPPPTFHRSPGLVSKLPESPSAKLRVGFAGYWGREKGLETLIEARRLLGPQDRLEFMLAGGAPTGTDPFVAAMRREALRVDPGVLLPGFFADDQLDATIAGLNALVLPYWPELPSGTSAMAMRAAECGVPVIAGDTPTLRGLLGDSAVYVRPKDAGALAAAIASFLEDPAPFFKNAEALKHRVFRDHGWDEVSRRLSAILDEVTS